jgi:hypothetical protein
MIGDRHGDRKRKADQDKAKKKFAASTSTAVQRADTGQ